MHGQIKIKTPEEIQKENERRDAEQYKHQKEAIELVFEMRKNKRYDEEAFKITTLLISEMTDAHVLWNIRKEIILHWKKNGHPRNKVQLSVDLDCPTVNNKDEKIGKPRENEISECTETQSSSDASSLPLIKEQTNANQLPSSPTPTPTPSESESNSAPKLNWSQVNLELMNQVYKRELDFTASCLLQNPKSYPTWYHRGFIIKLMPSPDFQAELKACDKLLNHDERNFHCWNYRRFICDFGKIGLKEELEFTEKKIGQNFSNFSSFYYRSSLLTRGHREKILDLNEVWQKEHETVMSAIFTDPNDQSPWFYYKWLLAADQLITYQPPKPLNPIYRIILDKKFENLIFQFHQPIQKEPFNSLTAFLNDGSQQQYENILWEKIGNCSSDIWFFKTTETNISKLAFECFSKDNTFNLKSDPFLSFNVVADFPQNGSLNPKSKLTAENLKILQDIYEMEPSNKWVILMLSSIHGQLREDKFDKLRKVDPLRKNYYLDQISRLTMEKNLEEAEKVTRFSLKNVSLTSLYHINRLTHLRSLDLTGNCLGRLPRSFNSLICLESLILDQNQISSIQQGFQMVSLQELSLVDNSLSLEALMPLKNCKTLKDLNLTNSIATGEEKEDVKQTLSQWNINLLM